MKRCSATLITLALALIACSATPVPTPTQLSTMSIATSPAEPTFTPALLPTPLSKPATDVPVSLIAGQWTALFFHDRLKQVILVNGGPDRGGKPSQDPLEVWSWDGHVWRLLSNHGPSWRNWAAAAYDSGRGVLVLHGGNQPNTPFDETWEWDGETWTLRASGGPGAREGASLAYDATRGAVVLFGGALGTEIMGDTWEWDGQTWKQLATVGPHARFNADMEYDPARQRVVLCGGHFVSTDSGDSSFYGDFWEWDGHEWSEIPLDEPNPGVRVATSLVPDPQTSQLLMFGGAGLSQGFFTDLWSSAGMHWTLLDDKGTPPRSGHNVVYDPVRKVFVLFGGVDHPGGKVLDETWEWDRHQWMCAKGCGT